MLHVISTERGTSDSLPRFLSGRNLNKLYESRGKLSVVVPPRSVEMTRFQFALGTYSLSPFHLFNLIRICRSVSNHFGISTPRRTVIYQYGVVVFGLCKTAFNGGDVNFALGIFGYKHIIVVSLL